MDDYYSILGVPRNASPDDIKKAYRKLAMQHHPDRGGDHDKFAKINSAYEVLSNSDKRSAYDNPQAQGFNWGGGGAGFNSFEDLFASQFGFNFQHRGSAPRNRDITIAATIDLIDVLIGKNLIIQYRLSTGEIETLTVEVPPGARDGDTVRYQELGDKGDPRFPRGNLNVRIQVRKHHLWSREGNNLLVKKTINVFDLLLGCAIIIETLDNKKVRVNIPKGTKPGTTFSISDYGIPDLHTRQRGHIYVTIEAEIPKIDNLELLNKIEEIRNSIYKD